MVFIFFWHFYMFLTKKRKKSVHVMVSISNLIKKTQETIQTSDISLKEHTVNNYVGPWLNWGKSFSPFRSNTV